MSGYRYSSSSYKYSSTGEDESNSSTRRSTFRSGLDDSELSSSSVSRTTRITSRTIVGDDEPEISTFSTTRHSTRLSSEDDSFGVARRALDDDSTSRLSRRLLEDDDAFSSKRTKVEVEGGMSGYSMRSTKVTTIDSSGEVKSFESSSKQLYSASFGGGDTQMLEDSSPIGSIYVAILDYKPLSTDEDGLLLREGEQVKVLDTSKPRKWKVVKLDSGDSGWVGSYCLEKAAGAVTTQEPATPTQEKPMELSLSKKETLVKELVDTEEDFARDMLFVVENYLKEMDSPTMPKRLREFKEQLFFNFKEICNFHNEQLITGIKYNAKEPSKLGTTLLRMERDFDKHVKYVEHESRAQQLLKDEPELKEHLDKFSEKIGDEKTIQEHLKLPLQRINDYQLILKELIKCNAKAGEDYTDLQRALDFMQAIPQRSTDLEFINKMEGYSGNIQKFGRILKEGKVLITDSKGRIQERHAFLFRGGRLCLTEVQYRSNNKKVYVMKTIIKTSDTTVTEEAGSLKIDSKTEGQIIMKTENKEDWNKQLQASTVKSEVVEKMSAEEELRVNDDDSTRMEVTQEDEANRTTTGVSDLEPRGTSPVKGEKPKFIQTLRGVSIHQNESATLECVIESEPAPALKWLKNNVPVRRGPRITQFSDEKSGRHSLTVTNAQPEDAAMYTIVASNPSGTTSCSAPFNVRTASGRPDSRPTSPGGTELPFAPVFKVKLKDTELLEGTSVRFELVVHGCPHPEVTFFKDGEPLQMDERIRVHYENKEVFELIIDHVTEADSAVYSCVAMNSEGCDSTAGCITVTKNKVLFQGLPEDANAGDKSTTPQPTASPAFTWFKDGREFEASERFQVAFNDDEDTLALVFQHVKPEDAGIYTCVASTFSGKISCSAELTVQGTVNYREPAAPTIEANMEDVEVNEGASAMLELKFTGWPKPRIVWTKGEKLIESGHGGKYKFLFEDDESMTLVIRSVTKEDGGKYDVVAENELGSAKTHCNLHVKCPPKFKKELKDASVMTETPLKLDVEVDGVPAPDVKWYKDGQQVTSTERVKLVHELDSASYALVVDKAKTEDAGSYTCVISNPLGSQSGHAAVTVNSAPKIIKKLESYEATLTETVTFTTKVSGTPKPTVEWLKDGKTVVIDGKKYIAAEEEAAVFSLTVDCCGPDDVGAYTVVVKNEFGKAEDSAELTIKIKPKFAKGLEDKELVEGEVDIQLNVVVEGKPEPNITWFHDGVEIKDTKLYATKQVTDKGEYTLVIKEAVAEAGGKIQCKAENKHGKAETEAKITVNAKPKITEGLKDQSVVNGTDAVFTVKYAGSPKPEARWLKDDAEIQIDGKHYRVSEAEAQFTLVIKECKDDDKGRYKCVVENKFGKDESSAELKILAKAMKKPSFAQGLKPTKFGEGELGRLEAKLNPNEDGSIPDVEWLKDGKPLTEADGVKFIKNPDGTVALEIPNCKPSDAGKYTLRAKNPDGGSAESSAPAEVVSRKPAFETELKGLKLTEGEELKLICKVKSETPITAKWFKDGKEVPADKRVALKVESDGTVLLVSANCEPEDAGKYRCEVTNQYGTSPSEADVTVQALKREKPLFIDGLKATAFDEGKPGKLEAKIGGFPNPEIQWLKDGKPISDPRLKVETKPDGTTTLKIDNVKPDDAGEYAIVAKNDQGESKSSAPVTVNKKPSFLKPLQDCTVPAGQTAKFSSQVAGSPKPKIEWLKDGKPLKPDGKRIVADEDDNGNCGLTIKDCTPADAGLYAIKASNPMGEMRSDAPLGIQDEKAPMFLSPLKDQAVAEGSKLVLEAKVMGTPAPDVKWFRNGKPVTEADGAKISFDGETARLEIPKAAMTDAGQYECKLASPSGEQSSKANVRVLKPPKFIKPLNDSEVTLGAPLVLECEVLCDDEPEISWTYRGAPIHDGAKYTITKTGTKCKLFIANPSVNDCGEFQCTAKNAAGQDSTACKGTIKEAETKPDSGEPPSFLKKLTDQELLAGSTAKLIACIAGKPEPDVKWFKNDVEVVMTDRHSFERDRNGIIRLVIKNLEADDFGEYRCEISNTHGKAHCCCKLSEDTTDLKYRKKDEKPAWKKLNYQISEEPKDEGKKKKDRGANDTEPDNGDHSDTDDFGFERPNFDGDKPSVVKYLKPDTGIPPSITDAPDIVRMTDHDCTLRWKPSIPKGPRTPVTYRVEMCDHPGGAWKPYASGIKDTTTDVKGLRPGQDYQFRVLVESKHGLSEPSPPVTAHRSKLAEKDDKEVPEKEFKPKDIDLGHDLDKDGSAPYFVRKEEEVMFGVKGRPVSIEFWVYGLPHPECTWYFKDEKIESGGRYEKIQDRNGQVLLCINRMHEECEGIYTCKAVNVHGEATKSIRLELAEEPHFTKRLEYTTIMLRQNGTLQCRCVGKPYPNIRWYKDWLPIATSGRTKISWEEPDLCIMKLDDSIMRDGGLYSCKATNIAGDATCSATVVIEQEEELYDLSTYKAPRVVRPRTKPFRDYYDIGEELGRGTQGVTYHAVARATGNSYAAKIMHHKDPQFKQWMKNEMDTMNQLAHPKLCRMWDAFESPDSMSLIMDLCGGGELLNNIIRRGGITEGQVANYVRQTLQGLDYMHARGIGHLGLTLGDLLVARVDADDIKIGDFSLATRIHNDRNFVQEYGHPEYVAPELAKKEPATLASDMWSVGVITYILLSGVSPFLGEHDRETLSNIKDGKMSFLPEGFDGVSDDARDFVAKLMVFEPEGRLNVKAALNHPWLKMADLPDRGPKLGNYERLVDYQEKWRKWYANANCRNCFRRRTLESCFYHPSKMIYPPGEPYTPPESPAHREREHVGPGFNYERKKRKYDTENFKNESNYAQGPDTYLLQLRDTDFPLRLRQYMKVGASRSPSLAASLRGQHWGGSDIFARGQEREHIYPQVVIRERRKFHDMMDEEIDDEKKGGDDHKSILLRLNKEVGAVGYIKNQTDAVRDDAWRFRGVTREEAIGTLPFFREKIDDAVIMDSNNVSFTAVAVGTPLPQFTWFRNDCPLLPTSRIKIDTDEATGTSVLTLAPGMAYDAGVFKCVARNASGTAVCRARLRMGDTPGRPAAPKVAQVTSKQMYVEWNAPRQENNARTLFFTLEYKKATDAEWQRIPEKITNEFYIVEDLQSGTKYEFRVTATNSFGNSVTSDASKAVSTEAADSTNKIKLSPTHSYQQVQTTDIAVGSAPVHDYSREQNPIPLKTSSPKDEYNFSAELSSGRFSVVMSATSKANSRLLAVKAVKNGRREYDMLKGLVHRNIVYLEDAFQNGDITLLVMERLSMNILAFLTLRNTYTEDQVSRVMKQVLDALEYLHFKGLVFCNVEPDSVCVTDGQSCIVKLVDFGSTHAVPKGGAQIAMDTEPEYMAPEVVRGEAVTYAADVWSAGVLMYILLSGVSPFLGATEAETRENVSMVRFHFESIYKECSSEATKLLIQVFKKCPTKRATIEECYENRWMLPSEYMLRKREACVFQSEKLAQFAQNYERAKRNRDNACMLLSNFGLNRITSPEA